MCNNLNYPELELNKSLTPDLLSSDKAFEALQNKVINLEEQIKEKDCLIVALSSKVEQLADFALIIQKQSEELMLYKSVFKDIKSRINNIK